MSDSATKYWKKVVINSFKKVVKKSFVEFYWESPFVDAELNVLSNTSSWKPTYKFN